MLRDIRTEAYEWWLRHYGDMIICSVNVIDQKPIQVVGAIYFDHPKMFIPLLHDSNTPVLLRFKPRALLGGNSKPGPLDPDSLLTDTDPVYLRGPGDLQLTLR